MTDRIRCEIEGCDREFKTRSGYLSHLRAHRRKGDVTSLEEQKIATDKKVKAAKRQANTFRKLYNDLLSQQAEVNNLVDRMKDSLSTVKPQGRWEPEDKDTNHEEEEVIALFSDSQIGTKSLGEEVGLTEQRVYGPMGKFNFNVFRYRLRIWYRAINRIVAIQRNTIPIHKLNLWFLGDVIEGENIFRSQGAYIETGVLQQYFASLYEVAQAVASLASNFEEIEIRAVTGNHGRVRTERNATKTWVNWEWLWYRYLHLLCRDLPNVHFKLTMSWFDLPVVQGYRWLMLHGEDARRYMRFPLNLLLRK